MTVLALSMPWSLLALLFPVMLLMFLYMSDHADELLTAELLQRAESRAAVSVLCWFYAALVAVICLSPASGYDRLLAVLLSLALFRLALTDALTGFLQRELTAGALAAGLVAAPDFLPHLTAAAAALALFAGWRFIAGGSSRFTQAVKSYTARYYDTLLASASTTAPVTITPAMLKATGFLEAGFSETTAEGQSYTAAVVRNSTNTDQLQGLVYTRGGAALPFLALRQIAMDISSGMGGYVWQAGSATGAMGGWSVPLASFGAATSQGHIAALLTADDLGAARGENDRLYRFAVTGRPDLNTMHTSIDMGANDLNNAGTVNAVTGAFSGNVTADGDIRSTGGWLITQDDKGWISETHGGGFYMSDNDWVRVVNNKGVLTEGQLQGGTVRAEGRLSTGEVLQLDGINIAGTSCATNGLVSRDASGALLSCQSGVWRGVSVRGEYVQLGSHRGTYSGENDSNGTLFIYATGGNGGSAGGDCANTSRLQGYVAGQIIAANADNSPSFAKIAFISFAVPPGAAYAVNSYPTENSACGSGVFTLYGYQM